MYRSGRIQTPPAGTSSLLPTRWEWALVPDWGCRVTKLVAQLDAWPSGVCVGLECRNVRPPFEALRQKSWPYPWELGLLGVKPQAFRAVFCSWNI